MRTNCTGDSPEDTLNTSNEPLNDTLKKQSESLNDPLTSVETSGAKTNQAISACSSSQIHEQMIE